MEQRKYNGWTNYATWRVNLELFDGHQTFDNIVSANYLKELAEEYLECDNELTKDYALAFLDEVNFYERAENINEQIEE